MSNKLKKGRQTNYNNRIGLKGDSGFIKQAGEVVISFPFKDCVLEGGMTTEESGREERFLHLQQDSSDIDALFDEKVLTDFRYIDRHGEKKLDENSDIEFFDADGELKQNLLIKGNNLLALHTLKSRLAGKVKLIYIDPPYNTGNDGFKYNDNFNHSTWLVFMKNRLEIARELLRDDGVIFVQCDDNEQAYLKVLMDEIFGYERFVGMFMWMKTSTPPSLSKNIRKKLEYILCYEKKEIGGLNGGIVSGGDMPLLNEGNTIATLVFPPGTVKFNFGDGIYQKYKEDRVELVEELTILGSYNQNILVLRGPFKWTQSTLDKELKNGTGFIIKSSKLSIRYERKGDRVKTPSNLISKTECNVGTNEDAKKELELLFNINTFDYPKPESLINYIVSSNTSLGDIVLDYHLGSGTTAAVAHKMGRRWIGIEQMDYIEDIAKVRLEKVIGMSKDNNENKTGEDIQGEQGGISKSVGWIGGGSFVYFELKKYNQELVDKIQSTKNKADLDKVYTEMKDNGFLQFWFDKKEFEKDENYKALPLEKQKKRLKEIIDLNHLYLNRPDMEDTKHKVTKAEATLTNKFYGKEN